MMLQFFKFLAILLIGSKNEPKYDLHKKQEYSMNMKGFNWTFILMTIAVILFFVIVWTFQIGNPYPNDLMSGNLSRSI